jgi:hypothetical protein
MVMTRLNGINLEVPHRIGLHYDTHWGLLDTLHILLAHAPTYIYSYICNITNEMEEWLHSSRCVGKSASVRPDEIKREGPWS